MVPHPEQQHIDIIADILKNGDVHTGRNGGYKSLFMKTMQFDITPDDSGAISVPVSTTAGTFLRGVIAEFRSFVVNGESNSKILEEIGVNIWRDNTRETDGEIGPAYGHNYRNYGGIYDSYGMNRDGVDQVARLVNEAILCPSSRRLVIINSDPAVNDECVLHPCQILFQVYLAPNGEGGWYLDMHAYNRSSDVTCAGMWNSAFAALMAAYLAALMRDKGLNVTTRRLIITLGNVHVYDNQVGIAVEHILRKPTGSFPKVIVNESGEVLITAKTVTEYSGLRYPMSV